MPRPPSPPWPRCPTRPVAFVSGRSLHDLREIAEHDDDSPIFLAGSHGAEFWVPGEGARPDRRRRCRPQRCATSCASAMTAELGELDGRLDRAEDVRVRHPHPRRLARRRAVRPRRRRSARRRARAALAPPHGPQHRRVLVPARGQGLRDRGAARAPGCDRRAVRGRRRHRRGRPGEPRRGRPRHPRRRRRNRRVGACGKHPRIGRGVEPARADATHRPGIDFKNVFAG